ncbi:MAG: bifunctional glutamate N-acetyltransferase/amino-acid acetyltransferase ArgJ [Pseudomonadota bacterium]
MTKVSRFAPASPQSMPPISGVTLSTCAAGIKYTDRTDLLLARFVEGTTVAGVFTRSRCASAPVDWCREHLADGHARALVVNAGNANAFTGQRGADAARVTADIAADVAQCAPNEVFLASTGVIGEPLDPSHFADELRGLAHTQTQDGWADAAAAIMTTDTYPKMASRTVDLGDGVITLNGIAKGSGMIAPDMATMLAFVATDADVPAPLLQKLLSDATGPTFNAITVDSDTSTSDTLIAFATGQSAAAAIENDPTNPRAKVLAGALHDLLHDLALQTEQDGEGITKFVTIHITGAEDKSAADTIARSVANSPLVKTAIAGEDPNWGRIVMAVGKAGEKADRDKLSIRFGDVLVAAEGERHADYREEHGAAVMKHDEIVISVDVGIGRGTATVYTCDLTHDYVSINADYRS